MCNDSASVRCHCLLTAITDEKLKQKAGRHLLELQAGIILEFPKQSIQYVDRDSLGPISLIWFGESNKLGVLSPFCFQTTVFLSWFVGRPTSSLVLHISS